MVWLNNLSVLGGSPVNTQIYQACQAANINVTDHPPSANSDQFTDSNGVQWTATLQLHFEISDELAIDVGYQTLSFDCVNEGIMNGASGRTFAGCGDSWSC
jgi:hypothetical protein